MARLTLTPCGCTFNINRAVEYGSHPDAAKIYYTHHNLTRTDDGAHIMRSVGEMTDHAQRLREWHDADKNHCRAAV